MSDNLPASLRQVPLESVIDNLRSGFASGEDVPDGIAQFRMNNVTRDGEIDWSTKRRVPVPSRGIRELLLEQGDILFNSTNSPELVGKTAYFDRSDEPVTFPSSPNSQGNRRS